MSAVATAEYASAAAEFAATSMTSTSDGATVEVAAGSHIRVVGALAGIGSGLAKVTVGHGFDTIKTRIQTSPPGTYRGAIDCLVRTVRNESFFALWKGMTPPMFGQAAIDSALLGSLHNYRLAFMRAGFVEDSPVRARYMSDADTEYGGKRLTLIGHGLAGLCAGFTSAIVATPIETLKVKLQVQVQRDSASRQFRGPLDCAVKVLRAQGLFGGLWRGYLTSSLYRSSFFWMFLSMEGLMRASTRLDGTPYEMSKGAATFWSGGLASFSFWVFGIPIDNIKNRIFSAPLSAPRISPLDLARQVWHAERLRGFYKGFAPCVLRALPANACAFFAFDWIMTHLGAEDVRGSS
ncbi:mitochondrial carrier [Exidia glandulosa HHB12029]|uniref:Mitochondrial carrier n=1 Tax=Exidia glandulosa HHB12029 TaxID=1314781 RepID=A0A165PBW4_EXIGL|nr:mitochondrial carrier [Exidia glandulosa HHB12029]